MTPLEQARRLAEIAEKMKTARGKQLDALVAEVDQIIGFDTGDAQYEAVRERLRHRKEN